MAKDSKAPKGQGSKGQNPKEKGSKGQAPKGQAAKGSKRSATRAEAAAPVEHTGVGLPVPPPRLRQYYLETVRPRLAEQFGLANMHQLPTLQKIVINVGLGEALKQPKLLDNVSEELAIITGQRPVRKKARKSIANFGLREGQEIGVAVTLRGARMWEFLDRLITVAIPRIRDFRGLNTRSFDGRGNYSMGIKEQMIFPEISYDQIEQIHGMDITLVTSTNRDDHGIALLRELGMPFRGEERPKGMAAA